MFSLIVVLISIALVALLVAATVYYGGSALTDSRGKAQAAQLKNEEQQILGAVDLFKSDKGRWPTDLVELVSAGYLSSAPAGAQAAGFISSAYAADYAWTTPVAGQPIYVNARGADVSTAACGFFNLNSRGDNGILKQAYTGLHSQCYGTEGSYKVVINKNGVDTMALDEALPSGEVLQGDMPDKTSDSFWSKLPEGAVTAPIDPNKTPVALLTVDHASLSFGNVEVGSSDARSLVVKNDGNLAATAGFSSVAAPFSVESACPSELAPGASCTATIRVTPVVPQAANATLSVTGGKNTVSVALSFQGITDRLALSSNSTDFGSVVAGAPAVIKSFTLANDGGAATSVSFSTVPAPFTVTHDCPTTLQDGEDCTVQVAFAPTTRGSFAMDFTATGAHGSTSLHATGRGLQGALDVSASSLSFGNTQVGEVSTAQQFNVMNNGDAPLAGLAVGPAAGFAVQSSACSTTLAAGASCAVTVSFAPTEARAYSAGITVSAAQVASRQVQLSGQSGSAQGSVTPAALAFGDVTVGNTDTKAVHVANTGYGSLSVAAGSLAAPFTVVNSCPASLAAGQGCDISVKFEPTQGTISTASLSVTVAGAAQNVAVTGKGLQAQLNGTALAGFGNVQVGQQPVKTVTLSNDGNTPVTGLALPSLPADFSLSGNTCTATLAVGATCTFNLTFAPSNTTPHNDAWSIQSANGGNKAYTLSGTGTSQAASFSASSLDFGNVAVGVASVQQTVLVINDGNGPLTVTGLTTASPFQASQSCGTVPFTVPVGGECDVLVTYLPTTMGPSAGSLTLQTQGGNQPVALSGTGLQAQLSAASIPSFGFVQTGSSSAAQRVTVTNTGNASVSGLTLGMLTGFATSGNTCTTAGTGSGTLAANASCTIDFIFSPSAAQVYDGNVNLTSGTVSVAIHLTGEGKTASATLTPATIDFGNVAVNAALTVSQDLVLRNTGYGTISVAAPVLPTGTPYSIVNNGCATTLAAGTECTVSMGFKPTTRGAAAAATVSIATGAGTKTATLTGTGTSAQVTFSNPANPQVTDYSFGDLAVGSTQNATSRRLTNSGNVAATGVTLALPAGFNVQATTCGSTLAAGTTCDFTVQFAPTAMQSYPGQLVVKADGQADIPVALGTPRGTVTTLVEDIALTQNIGLGPALSYHYAQWRFTNSGNTNVTIGSMDRAGSAAGVLYPANADASVAAADWCRNGATVAPGATCSVMLGYDQAQFAQTTVIPVTATMATSAGTKNFSVSGTTAQLGWTEVTPLPSTVSVGNSYDATYRVTNAAPTNFVFGGGTVLGNRFSQVDNTGAAWTAKSTTCGATLAPNGTCDVTFTFTPTATGVAYSTSFYAFGYLKSFMNRTETSAVFANKRYAGIAPGTAGGTTVSTVAVISYGSYYGYANGTFATSCASYKTGSATYVGATTDGSYRLASSQGTFDAYCDMSTDGGGWMLIVKAQQSTNAHADVNAVGTVSSPSQTTVGKYSDAVINALPKSAYRMSNAARSSSVYFDTSGPFVSTTQSASKASRTIVNPVWEGPFMNEQHRGLNTYATSSFNANENLIGVYTGREASDNCRLGMATAGPDWCGAGSAGTVWMR